MITVLPCTGRSLERILLRESLNLITDHFDQERATAALANHFVDCGDEVHR